MKRLLFVCSRNRLRSPTAEQVFSAYDSIECASAGTGTDAEVPVSGELVEWADLIFVMEKAHRVRLNARFAKQLPGKRLICLDIPDNYAYMQPELVQLLKTKVSRHLPGLA
jgi:predicted protein tyrosine phosphatase